MWNLTPEYIQQVKDELKGRRAAIQARYADELKTLQADLEEVETLERVAYAVAVKHLPEQEPGPAEPAEGIAELQPAAEPQEEPQAAEVQAEAPVPEQNVEHAAKGLSRWRMRLESNTEAETA